MPVFRYDAIGRAGTPFEVPGHHFEQYVRPRAPPPPDPGRVLRAALDHPDDADPLEQTARRAGRVLVLIDDHARRAPTAMLLPHIVGRLARAGVVADRVTALVAAGTQRPLSRAEIEDKVGMDLAQRWRVAQHDGRDRRALLRLGATRAGMPVTVNRLVADHDLILGVGAVHLHTFLGYGGGANLLVGGAGGEDTLRWLLQAAAQSPVEEVLGVPGHALRRTVEEAGRAAGLDAVLNIVPDRLGRIQAAAYGDPVAAHRHLVPTAQALAAAPVGREADVVVTDAYPADRSLWHSLHALLTASVAARPGASLVLAAPNLEGVAPAHPGFLAAAGEPLDAVREALEDPHAEDPVGLAMALHWSLLRTRARVHLVADGIGDDDARRLGATPHPDLQTAVDTALAEQGRGAGLLVLQDTPALLPLVEGRNAARHPDPDRLEPLLRDARHR